MMKKAMIPCLEIIKRYVVLLFGLFIFAIAFNVFLLPNDLVFGGVSGLAILIEEIFSIEPYLFISIMSLLLILLSFIALGKAKTSNSILGSILLPVFIKLTEDINLWLQIDVSQVLLSAVFGAILAGIGLGLVFKTGYTTGGTDIVKQIIHKYFHLSMGKSGLIIDGFISVCSIFVFGITKFMYALIVLYIMSCLTDKVMLGISDSKAFYIITDKDKEVKDYIINVLNHGVTLIDAKGGFSNEKEKVLFCVIPTREYFKFKDSINKIDKQAFFVVTDAYEVFGGE